MEKITVFNLNNSENSIKLIETIDVKPGVSCDVYSFDDDETKDLAIITVENGAKTPLQLVLKGESTTEGYYSGNGTLKVINGSGEEQIYRFDADNPGSIEVKIGEKMQWQADEDSELVFYEICQPPYEDGRYQNLEE